MPITKELENLRKFESAGFTHEQAEVLAETLEKSHVDSQQSLKEFISKKFDDAGKELINLELRIRASQTDLLIKYLQLLPAAPVLALQFQRSGNNLMNHLPFNFAGKL